MKFKNMTKYAVTLPLLAASSIAIAAEDVAVTGAVSAFITDAGDTAKAVVLLLLGASVVVMASYWAWKMVRRGGGT